MSAEYIIVEIKKFAAKNSNSSCECYNIEDSDYSCGYFHGKYIAFGEIVDYICELEKRIKK